MNSVSDKLCLFQYKTIHEVQKTSDSECSFRTQNIYLAKFIGRTKTGASKKDVFEID